MKKLTFIIFFISIFIAKAQYIQRGDLVLEVYQEVYGGTNPSIIPVSQFPNPYYDIDQSFYLSSYINVLAYLEFNDGVSVFSRNTILFQPDQYVSRGEIVKVLLEAWNLSPSYSGSVPYSDVNNPYVSEYYHIVEAYNLGLLPYTTNFYPYDYATYSFYNDLINGLYNISPPPTSSQLNNLSNYFVPNNFTPNNLSIPRGIEQGVFSHYAKNSFVIPDVKFNLNFSHYYSTELVELPESYFSVKPLGRGWTHTYNSYITRKNNVIGTDDLYYIVWSDGTIHVYNQDQNEYITHGVYDEVDEYDSGDVIRIKKKDQTRFYFERLDNDQDVFYLNKIKDSNGNEINIDYEESEVDDDFERINWVEAPSGKKLRFYYHSGTDFIDYISDPIGRQIRFTYNEERLRYFYDAKGQSTRYYYVSNDEDAPEEHQYKRFLLRKVKLPRGNVIEAEYDEDNNGKLKQYWVNDNEPIEIDLDIDYGSPNPVSATLDIPMPDGEIQQFAYQFNSNGLITHFENDIHDLDIYYPTSGVNVALPTNTNLNGLEIDYEYDDRGNVVEIQKENLNPEKFWYSSENELKKYQDANGNVTRYYYDDYGNLEEVVDALDHSVFYDYDNHGQVTSITNQEGINIQYSYENDGALEGFYAPEGVFGEFTYDGINRLLTKNICGLTSQYAYDLNDNLTTFTNTGGLTTVFDYDENDNLSSITNANGIVTSFEYNDKDQVKSENFAGVVKNYEYNDDGTLHKIIKPSGNVIKYDYTSNGQLNEAGLITDIDYNSDGLVSRIYNDSGLYRFYYDNVNRLEVVEDEFSDKTIEYVYDDVGNIKRIIYPDGGVNCEVLYTYDVKNRLIRVRTKLNGNYSTIAEYSYRDDDLLEYIEYGNGISSQYFYDEAGRRTGVAASVPTGSNTGNVLFSENVTLDNRGNILMEERYFLDEETQSSLPTNSYTYSYDDNNHVTTLNGLQVNVTIDGNTTYKPLDFDNDGNTDAAVYYNYDLEDRLTNVTSINNAVEGYPIQNVYDVYGNRIARYTNSGNNYQKFTWDIINGNILLDKNNLGSDIYYIWGATGLEASINADNGNLICYFHGDLRGSVVVTSNESANNFQFNKYDDFGNVIQGRTEQVVDNLKFLGKYGITLEQKDFGHYNIKARHYDASIGRFLTQDPIWSTNLYPYANNNPISRIDPSGKSSSLVSLMHPPKDPKYDLLYFGLSGTYSEVFGGNSGANLNFLISGDNASFQPILTGTSGPVIGQDVGFSFNIGLCRDWISGGLSKDDLESDGDNNHTFNVGLLLLGISVQNDELSDGRRLECNVVTIGPTLTASYSQNRTKIISLKQIWNY